MPNSLVSNDTMIAQNFFLEIDGEVVTTLTGVSGLDTEVEVSSITQTGKNGQSVTVKTLASANKAGDLTLTRAAPLDATADKLWKWFNDIRNKGMAAATREGQRKNGSVVLYDSANSEVARFNFFMGWPSKISTDALSADSTEAVKETITLTIERLDRVK